jgi:hypothetical protein
MDKAEKHCTEQRQRDNYGGKTERRSASENACGNERYGAEDRDNVRGGNREKVKYGREYNRPENHRQ